MVTITLCNGVEISKEEWTRLREMNPRMQPAQIKAAFERNLDDAVMNALDIHSQGVPRLDISRFSNPMIVGSGNAIAAAKIVFAGRKAVFADETNYQAVFAQHQPDGVTTIDRVRIFFIGQELHNDNGAGKSDCHRQIQRRGHLRING